MQGKAFNVNGFTYSSRKNPGKISVGDRVVKIKAQLNNTMLKMLFSQDMNHSATPVIAIIKVGDSAL